MKRIILLSIILSGIATIDISAQGIIYQDVALSQGIDHTFDNNTSGSGVSFVDFDGDGYDDITLGTNDDDIVHFYKNTGFGFERIDIGISLQENTKSIIWVDYDNDGDKDLYISGYSSPNRLFQNLGDMNFVDHTEQSNLPTTDSLNTYGAIWGDYDRDGWLDLYYTERVNSASQGVHRNRLWKNQGDGSFTDKTYSSMADDSDRLPFCAAFVDMNNDKWPDIYIANDKKKRNTLLQNNKDGTYKDISEESGGGIEMDAMCVAPGDYNNDGLIDIYLSNIPEGGKLLTNDSTTDSCFVIENAEECMVTLSGGVGWGSVFLDVNNDGWEDLYISGMLVGNDQYSSQLFLNDQVGAFYEDDLGFVGDTVRSFNNAIGDIDNDGQMEIMVINSGGYNSQLWKSEVVNKNWIKINLTGVISNRDGIGAWINLYVDNKMQSRYTTCGNGFMGQNSENIHLGLDDAQSIDSISITWPTGHVDKLYNIESNQLLQITEGESTNGNIHIDNDIDIVSSITNIVNEENNIILYPNPTTDKISIESKISITDILIYNMNGTLISHQVGREINTSQLTNGVYSVVMIGNDNYLDTQKIIKL